MDDQRDTWDDGGETVGQGFSREIPKNKQRNKE